MKNENKTQLKPQINQQNQQQQQNQQTQNQAATIFQNSQQISNQQQKESINGNNLDFVEDAKKRGWKGEQLFTFNDQNQTGSSSTNNGSMLLGQIYYENYAICSASLISPSCLVSITQNQIKLRPQSLKFKLLKQQSYDIEVYEQKEIENYNLILFRLKQRIGDKLGYFGVITYLDKIFYEQFDIQNKKKTVSIPHYVDQQYIADITDDSVSLMKNKVNQKDEEIIEFLGLPLIVNDPFLGMFIIGLVIKSTQQNFKAILFQLSHLQFLKGCIANKDTLENELIIKEDLTNFIIKKEKSVLKNIQKLESKVIYQSNGDLAHKDGIYTICRLNNNCLASSSVDKSIRVWDWKGQTLLNNLDCDGCCRYFVCEDNMLVGTSENYVIIIDWHSKKIEGVIPCKNKLYSLLMYKHKTIFAGDCYGNINVINNSNLMYYIRNHEENTSGHRGSVNVMHKINSIPNIFFSAGEYGEIKVWDCENFELKGDMIGHDKEKSVYYLESIYQQNQSNNQIQNNNSNQNEQNNSFLISGSSDKTIRIWNVYTFKQIRIIQLLNPIYAACMINSSEMVIGDGNCIRIMNIQNQKEDVTIEKHESRVNAICKLSETSFASGDIEGSIVTWSLKKPPILIKDGSDGSIINSYYQEKQTIQNEQNVQQEQKNKQSLQQQNAKSQDISNKSVLKNSNLPQPEAISSNHSQQENQATVKKSKPTFGYGQQTFEIIENENQKKENSKLNSRLSNNHSPILQENQGTSSMPQQNFGEKMQMNDIQFTNPYYESTAQHNKGNLSVTDRNQKKKASLNYPLSTQNARQPPQQKLSVEFFKEDPQNNNNEAIERGRKKIENQFSSTTTSSQNQEIKRASYNDKSPFVYKKGTQQLNLQQQQNSITNTQLQRQNEQKLESQKDIQNQQHNSSNLTNSIKNHYSLQSQNSNNTPGIREGYHSHQNNNNDILQKQEQQVFNSDNLQVSQNMENLSDNDQFRTSNSRNTNYKNNSNSFNNQQPSQGSSTNTSDINSGKGLNQNSSSFVDLLKQFDDNDKYQIIHQRKIGTSTSPIQKSPNLNCQSQQASNQAKKSLRDPVFRNQELKELQQHYDQMIDKYLSQKSNKNQFISPINDQFQINEHQSSSNKNCNIKQLALDKKTNSKENDSRMRSRTPDKLQTQKTPKQNIIQNKNLKEKEILIEIDFENEEGSCLKGLSNNSTASNKQKSNRTDQKIDSQLDYQVNLLSKGLKNVNNNNQQVKNANNYEEKEKDMKIEKLYSENNELKKQITIQNQQMEKYEAQIQKLIETLQRSEEERVQIINEIKQITPQLSKYSDITTELNEKNEHQQYLIQKQEEEIVDLKEYIIDLTNQMQILKQAENSTDGYQEEVSLNPIQNKNMRIIEEKRGQYIQSPQKQTELLSNNNSNQKQHPSSHNNNYIHISEFLSSEDGAEQQFKNNFSSPQKQYKKQLSQDNNQEQQQNQNTLTNQEQSTQLQNREKIMIQLKLLQQEALQLHKEITSLKSKTSECQNESEMISLLNQLQQTHSLYELKNDEITELKTLYNLY